MFNVIWNALKAQFGMAQLTELLAPVSALAAAFEKDYFTDKTAKNAAIDAICEILQQHKDV